MRPLNFGERIALFICWPVLVSIIGVMLVLVFCLLVICWPLILIPRFVKLTA